MSIVSMRFIMNMNLKYALYMSLTNMPPKVCPELMGTV